MIELSAPIQQDKIIELLDGLEKNGMTFKYKEKKGIKLFFEVETDDLVAAARLAKESIKAEPWGSVLYFQASAVE